MTGRGSISHTATLRLWVLAGGRCEYRGCNTHLLEDDVTSFELNLADRAHIVGATDAPVPRVGTIRWRSTRATQPRTSCCSVSPTTGSSTSASTSTL